MTHFIVEAPKLGQTLEECRILIILAGRPSNDLSFLDSVRELGAELEALEGRLEFAHRLLIPCPHGGTDDNRRGGHKTGTMGTSYGGGQTVRSRNAAYACSKKLKFF